MRGVRFLVLIIASASAFNFLCSPSASAQAKDTVLYDFACGGDGCGPVGNLARDNQGNLYGTTSSGGDATCNCGTVYELTPIQGGGWSETVLHAFTGGSDGSQPTAGVIIDSAGGLYGVTYSGGTGTCGGGCGTVFKLTHSGSGWTESVIYAFVGGSGDGANPLGGLVFDKSGDLYGTTQSGGVTNVGTVFELSPSAEGWNEILLHSFSFPPDGYNANTKLAIDDRGDLYGTTTSGGVYDYGTVFRLVPSKSGWTETIIWDFTPSVAGLDPNGVIVHGNALYGTTVLGGAFNIGDVFQLTPAIGIWTYTAIYNFTGGRDGGEPGASLAADPSHLYGTTCAGGRYQFGTVFRLTRNSDGTWAEGVLYNFTDGTDGECPNSPLLFSPQGLFGSAGISPGGLVYEITAP